MGVSVLGEYFEINKIERRHISISGYIKLLCCLLGFDQRLFDPLQFPECCMLSGFKSTLDRVTYIMHD